MTHAVHTVSRSSWEHFSRRWEELKSIRLPFEAHWDEVRTYVMPRKQVGQISRPHPLPPRNLVDATAVTANQRLANILHGYLFSPFAPFFKAVLSDRDPSHAERVYFGKLDKAMHRYLTGSKAPFRVNMGATLHAASGLGTSCLWIGARTGHLPVVNALPAEDCWIDENPETGLVDTLYRQFRWPAWRAAQRYPGHEKIDEAAEKNPNAMLTFVMAIEPNAAGAIGGLKHNKPFTERTFSIDHKIQVGDVEGYDDFPGSAIRFYRTPGTPYGYGPGTEVLTWAKLLNAVEDNALQAQEQNWNPALIDMTNGAIDPLDRRPGSRTPFDTSMMMGLRGVKPFERMFEVVDLRDSPQRVADLRFNIEKAFFTDWLSPRESGTQTATEVNDRRDIRLRAMASVVSGMEYDFNQMGERFFLILQRGGFLPDAPASLDGKEIHFEFISPLRMAQSQGEVEKVIAFLEVAGAAAALDPIAGRVPNAEALARGAGRNLGIPEDQIRSLDDIEAERQAQQQQEQAAQDAALAQQLATTFRDGAQGAASLANSGPAGLGGPQ